MTSVAPSSPPPNPQRGRSARLVRQLGMISATALVISNMVGTGIFATTGYMAGDLGSAWRILLCWSVGALFALCGALSYSELGINFPNSGGEYVYLTRAWGPGWGFVTGWVSFFAGFSAPIALAALAFADYVGYFFPGVQLAGASLTIDSGLFSIRFGGAPVLAAALIAVFTLLNCFGLGRAAKVQNVLTAAKLLTIVCFIVLGVFAGSGDWGHFSQNAVRTSALSMPAQFMVSLLWVMVGYSGWNAATYVAEELKDPVRILPRALAVGTGVVALLYLGLNLVYIYATPLEAMKGVVAVGSQAATNLFGPRAAGAFAGLMAVSLAATVNAEVTIGPRVCYAMAQNRAFFKAAAKVNPSWRTPAAAILAQGVCAMLLTFTPFPHLIVYIGFSLTLFSVMAVAGLFVFRRQSRWRRLKAVSFAFPLVPGAYLVVGAAMIAYGAVWQPAASFAAAATMAAGALVYRCWFKDGNTCIERASSD